SQASASSKPPVIATPLTAPMIGFGHAAIAAMTLAPPVLAPLASAGFADSPPISLRSRPAQKAFPAPVKMTAPTESSRVTSANASTSAWRSSVDSAFIACGRLNVSVAMESDFSTSRTDMDSWCARVGRARWYACGVPSMLQLLHFLGQLGHRLEEV